MNKNGALFNTPNINSTNINSNSSTTKSKLDERYRQMENDTSITSEPELPAIDIEELKKTKFSGKSGMSTNSNIFTKSTNNVTIPNPGMTAEKFYLPSKNLLYGEDFDGHFNMRMFTTKEERMRVGSGKTFLQTMCAILNNCITTDNNINIDTSLFTEFDFVYTMYMARIISYGPMYSVEVICPSCYNRYKHTVDLDKLKVIYLDDTNKEPLVIESLPKSKDKLELRYLRIKDRIEMSKEAEEIQVNNPDYIGNPEYNLHLEYSIEKINGDTPTKTAKRNYVDNLPAIDAQYINYILNKTNVGIDTDVKATCPHCGRIHNITLSMNSTFFRPEFND